MKSVLLIGYSASLLAAIICVLLAAIQKASREQKTILLVTVFIFISTLGYWFSIQSTNMQSRLIAQKLIYVGGSHLYFLMLVFFSQYCSIKLPRCLYWISIIFDTFIMLSVMFCEYHPYFYRSMEYVNRNGIPDLKKEYGFIHYLYVAGILLYSTGMFLVSIRHMMQKRGKQRNLANIGLLLVIACPTTLYLCEKLLDLDYYIVPFGLIVGEVIIIVLIYRLKIYDVNATATEYIFETIQDVIITTDKDMRYKGSNQKALELYPKLKSAVMNMDIRELGVDFDKLNREGQSEDIVVNERIYAPHVKPIKKKNQVAGYVIWLYDVTEMRQHTMLLENYQKDLEKEVLTKTIQLQGMQEHMLTGFANIMESRDGVTGGHAKRTGAYVNAIVEELLRKHSGNMSRQN